MQFTHQSILIGIDVHKFSHTAVAINFFGQKLAVCTFANSSLERFFTWVQHLGPATDIVVGVEDIRGYGLHVATAVQKFGLACRYVPPVLTDREKRYSTHRLKNDEIDAERVGKVMLHKWEQTLPAGDSIHHQYQSIRSLDLLVQERSRLVKQQTGLKNQLHSLLHQHYGDTYQQGFKSCFTQQARDWYMTDLAVYLQRDGTNGLVSSCIRHFQQLELMQSHIKQISTQMAQMATGHSGTRALLDNLPGCGLESACRIVAEIGTIKRFATKAKLARYAGVAPREQSSGRRIRYYTDYRGNRRLNRGLHTIALSQIALYGPDYAKVYYRKKHGEGKTKLWSLRCLKRRICDKVFTILWQAE